MSVWEQSRMLRRQANMRKMHIRRRPLVKVTQSRPTYSMRPFVVGGIFKRGAFWKPENHPFWSRHHLLVAR